MELDYKYMSAETVGLVPADVKAAEAGKRVHKDHETLVTRIVDHLHMIPAAYAYQVRRELPPPPNVDPDYLTSAPDPIDAAGLSPHLVYHPNDWAPYPNPALGKNIV